jgi:hypothetical protein
MNLFALNDNTLELRGLKDVTDGTLIVDSALFCSLARKDISGAITAITPGQPLVITAPAHGRQTGDRLLLTQILGTTAANGVHTITRIDADAFSLDGTSSAVPTYSTNQAKWYLAVPGAINLAMPLVDPAAALYRAELPYTLPLIVGVGYTGDVYSTNYGDRWSPDVSVVIRK